MIAVDLVVSEFFLLILLRPTTLKVSINWSGQSVLRSLEEND